MSTELEDQLFLLQDAFDSIWDLADFLFNCLEEPGYNHAYPEMSRAILEDLKSKRRKPTHCLHPKFDSDCPGCQAHLERHQQREDIKAGLTRDEIPL